MKGLAKLPARSRLLRVLLVKQTVNQSDHCSAIVDNPKCILAAVALMKISRGGVGVTFGKEGGE